MSLCSDHPLTRLTCAFIFSLFLSLLSLSASLSVVLSFTHARTRARNLMCFELCTTLEIIRPAVTALIRTSCDVKSKREQRSKAGHLTFEDWRAFLETWHRNKHLEVASKKRRKPKRACSTCDCVTTESRLSLDRTRIFSFASPLGLNKFVKERSRPKIKKREAGPEITELHQNESIFYFELTNATVRCNFRTIDYNGSNIRASIYSIVEFDVFVEAGWHGSLNIREQEETQRNLEIGVKVTLRKRADRPKQQTNHRHVTATVSRESAWCTSATCLASFRDQRSLRSARRQSAILEDANRESAYTREVVPPRLYLPLMLLILWESSAKILGLMVHVHHFQIP